MCCRRSCTQRHAAADAARARLRARCEHRVGTLSDKLTGAHTELSKVVWSAEQMSNTMPRRHHMRWAMDIIEESIKKSAVAGEAPDSEDAQEDDYDYEDIHVRLARAASAALRALLTKHAATCTGAGRAAAAAQPRHRRV